MIGNVVKAQGVKQPKSSSFANIKKGDTVVYYASKDYVVVGIFQVISDIEYLPNDLYWKEIMIYRIKPLEMPLAGKYLDFKKLIKDPKVNFDLFPNKRNWGNYLQGKTCVLLTEKDYLLIRNSLSNTSYLKTVESIKVTPTKWHKKHSKQAISIKETKVNRHQAAIDKWRREEENKFGGIIRPQIETNAVDLNEILPKEIWLKNNKKYIDALARLDIGGQPFYQSVLEVQHKGSKEDLCVRVSIVLPFVTRVDIVSDEDALTQIKELLERVADPNIVKSRVRFYSFKEFLSS